MEACEYGQEEVAGYLARDPHVVTVANSAGDTALHVLAKHGQVDVLEALLPAAMPTLSIENDANEAPLVVSSREGHLTVVREFLHLFETHMKLAPQQLKQQADALLAAACEDRLEVVQLLLEHGASPNEVTSSAGVTPLLMSALNGHIEVVRELIRGGADVNQIASSDGFFPLLAACQNGHAETVRILLEAGADPLQSHGEEKQTSLEMAMYRGHEQIAEILREAIGEG